MIRHPITPQPFEIPEEDIRKCAYFFWLEAGRPAGRDEEFWNTARETLRQSAPYQRAQAGPVIARWRAGQNVRTPRQEARSGLARIRLG